MCSRVVACVVARVIEIIESTPQSIYSNSVILRAQIKNSTRIVNILLVTTSRNVIILPVDTPLAASVYLHGWSERGKIRESLVRFQI